MEIPLFESSNGLCPYLEGKEWLSYLTHADYLDIYLYEAMINRGFRRSGRIFYQNQCRGCESCVPIRVLAEQFVPSKSQRKIWKKNQDLKVTLQPAKFDAEAFAIYDLFTQDRFNCSATAEDFQQFLVKTAVDTQMAKYYDHTGKMVAVGWLDILHQSISSVYCAFDPKESKRSLGTFSVLWEIELCKQYQKDFLHLGFWVKECQSMAYKSRFYPHQLLVEGVWAALQWSPKAGTPDLESE